MENWTAAVSHTRAGAAAPAAAVLVPPAWCAHLAASHLHHCAGKGAIGSSAMVPFTEAALGAPSHRLAHPRPALCRPACAQPPARTAASCCAASAARTPSTHAAAATVSQAQRAGVGAALLQPCDRRAGSSHPLLWLPVLPPSTLPTALLVCLQPGLTTCPATQSPTGSAGSVRDTIGASSPHPK